jgi:hypothetical protein
MQPEFSPNIGPMFVDTATCDPSRLRDCNSRTPGEVAPSDRSRPTLSETSPENIGELTSSAEATHVKATPSPDLETSAKRALAVNSSALLSGFARELWSEKTQHGPAAMLPGLGGECETSLNESVTRYFRSDCEPVVLALSINGTDCCCSPSLPTPKASAANYGRPRKGDRGDLQAAILRRLELSSGLLNPEFVETMQGFPTGWTDLGVSEIPLQLPSPNGSDDAS